MLIKNITLYNYRLYKGVNTISFNFNNERNIFLVSGENGFGKTTFLHSLLWCLYGRLASDVENNLRKEVANGGYYALLKNNLNISQKAILDSIDIDTKYHIKKFGYTPEVDYIKQYSQYYVEIEFHEVIIPSIPCSNIKIRRGYDAIVEKEYIEIFIDNNKNELTNEIGPEIFINDFILNKDIARFFFFDSEQIVSLAETNLPSERKRLCSAYNEVLGVRKYEDLRTNLNNVRLRFRKRSNDVGLRNKIDHLIEERQKLENEITKCQSLIDNLDEQLISLNSTNEEFQLQLIREGNNATMEEINRLHRLLEVCSTKDKEYKTLLKSFLEYAPLAMMGNLFADTKVHVDADYRTSVSLSLIGERNNLVANITSDLMLMFNELHLDSALSFQLQNHVKDVLSKYRSIDKQTNILFDITTPEYKEFCSIFNYITSTYRSEFERLADDYKKNKQVLERTSRRLSIIETKEKDALIADIRQRKNEVEQNITQKNIQLRELLSQIGEKKQMLATVQKQISELLKRVDLDDLDGKKDALAQELISELSSFLRLLKEEKKVSLEQRIKSILNSLMHKGEFITKVVVKIDDDDMDIDLYTKDNTLINKDTLSKGEQQLYASTLLKALVEESGIKFPVFIDSPLQKFDKSHASKIITDFYPTISSQVVLFPLLYKELTLEELELMTPMINECFIIKNDVDSSHFVKCNVHSLMSTANVQSN